MSSKTNTTPLFSRYQVFVIALIAILQFTVVLDFMVMAPLGAMLIDVLHITPSQFGWVVSAYAFSAGISGIVAAGFADKFDRKKVLLFFYAGFTLGTLLCGIAPGYKFLLFARMITGLFAGVIYSFNMAIIADLFPLQIRGRVMGYVQMAFAVSQAVGIPVGLYFANQFGWHMPFLIIIGLCLPLGFAIIRWLKPVTTHLEVRTGELSGAPKPSISPLQHLLRTARQKQYLRAFLTTVFLSTGGFLIMPYSSAYLVHNVGISEKALPLVFVVAGCSGLLTGPLIGKWTDKLGKYRVFMGGTILATIMVVIMTHLSVTPLWEVLILNTLMYTAVMSRMIPSQALVSGVPDLKDRGAFMSINASVQQMGGGFASVLGGWIIGQNASGELVNYGILGYVTIGAFAICLAFMSVVNSYVIQKTGAAASQPSQWKQEGAAMAVE